LYFSVVLKIKNSQSSKANILVEFQDSTLKTNDTKSQKPNLTIQITSSLKKSQYKFEKEKQNKT
jgi:hypothetical protein